MNELKKAIDDTVAAVGLAAASSREVKRLNHEIVECLVSGACYKELLEARQKELAREQLLTEDWQRKKAIKRRLLIGED